MKYLPNSTRTLHQFGIKHDERLSKRLFFVLALFSFLHADHIVQQNKNNDNYKEYSYMKYSHISTRTLDKFGVKHDEIEQ